ncbi:hypothetical protein D9M69_652860 [compost metagenome]
MRHRFLQRSFRDADAVVDHAQHQAVFIAFQGHADHAGTRIFHDIRQRFLHDTEQGNRQGGFAVVDIDGHVRFATNRAHARKILAIAFDGGAQAQVVQQAGAQILDDAALELHRFQQGRLGTP